MRVHYVCIHWGRRRERTNAVEGVHGINFTNSRSKLELLFVNEWMNLSVLNFQINVYQQKYRSGIVSLCVCASSHLALFQSYICTLNVNCQNTRLFLGWWFAEYWTVFSRRTELQWVYVKRSSLYLISLYIVLVLVGKIRFWTWQISKYDSKKRNIAIICCHLIPGCQNVNAVLTFESHLSPSRKHFDDIWVIVIHVQSFCFGTDLAEYFLKTEPVVHMLMNMQCVPGLAL